MEISLTNKQYRDLIVLLSTGNSIYGSLGDLFPSSVFKGESERFESLEKYFLKFAKDFECEDMVEECDGHNCLDEEFYCEEIMAAVSIYDEAIAQDTLANKLAWRDFKLEHREEEIKKMAEKNQDYFGVELHQYEKRYYDEFEKNGYDRLCVDESDIL